MNDPSASPQDIDYSPSNDHYVNYEADSSGPSIKIYPPTAPPPGEVAELQPGEVATPIRMARRGGNPVHMSVPTEIRFRDYSFPETDRPPKNAKQREQDRKNEITMARHPLTSDEGGVQSAVEKIRRSMAVNQAGVPGYNVPPEAWKTAKEPEVPLGLVLCGVAGFITAGVLIFLLVKYMNSPPKVVADVVKKAAKTGVLRPDRLAKVGKSIAK